ncbi:MAG: hypothetical protein QOJ38_8 [Solirubrobacterales bacterium]|jgi:hypothetical protein|nr:hypothetical protein [Solirubrobacterales bacterium]
MQQGDPRLTRPKTEYFGPGTTARLDGRPDRLALWAFVLALFVIVIAAASAHASSGGISGGGGGGGGSSSSGAYATNASFGERTLRKGDRGDDVKTLNLVLKSLPYAGGVQGNGSFKTPTYKTVRKFQANHRLPKNGVVTPKTRKALAGVLSSGMATYYDLTGNTTACGQRLRKGTIGFATNTSSPMKCGAVVVFKYGKRWVRATKMDTGPGVRCFDLTIGLKRKLGFPDAGSVNYAVPSGPKPC